MTITYPPSAPQLTGDIVSINRFLSQPSLIARRLRTLAEQRFIADVALSGRYQVNGGSVLYEQSETIYSDRLPQSVAPGAEYPMTTISTGPAQMAKVEKWGQDAHISDESVKRLLMDPVNRALIKMTNQLVKTVDGFALAAIASQVTQSTAATAGWGTTGAKVMSDIAHAQAGIRALNQGYDPDLVIVDDNTYANLIADPTLASLLRREDGNAPIYTGAFPEILGLRILPTPNLPVPGKALVCDSKVLGGMADENLGGPGYVSTEGVSVEVKTIRDDASDLWKIRARRVTVPVVIEPNSAWFINGV